MRISPIGFAALLVACSGHRTQPPTDTFVQRSRGTLAITALDGETHHRADNGALRAFFVRDRVRLVRGGTIEMHLTGIGRAKVKSVSPARVATEGLELRLVRDGVTEWYANDARGLEQGFDLTKRPEGDGELSVVLAFDADAHVTTTGDEASITRANASIAVRGLAARDARGRALPTRFETDGATLSLRVDDGAATYPISIDPWYGAAPIKLTATDAFVHPQLLVDGDTALVADTGNDSNMGAGFVFVRDAGGAWTQQAKLVKAARATGDYLGSHPALVGDTAVLVSSKGTTIFNRSGTTWTVQAQLTPTGPVVLLGDGILLTASTTGGATFVRSGSTWSSTSALPSAPPSTMPSGFAISGKTVILGYANDGAKGTGAGSAVVHVFDGTNWNLQQTLYASDPLPGAGFGGQVAIAGDRAAVAVPTYSSATAIYLFARSGTTWTQTAKITEIGKNNPSSTYDAAHWVGDAAVRESGLSTIDQSFSLTGTGGGTGGLFVSSGTLAQDGKVLAGSGSTWSPAFAIGPLQDMTALSGLRVGVTTSFPAAASIYELGAALPNGTACTVGEQCMSGFCIDGVCCNDGCSGGTTVGWPYAGKSSGCFACTAALKGAGGDGTCEPVLADTDPHDTCPTDAAYPASCKSDGMCDGKGSCRTFAKAGTACGATSCAAGSVTGLTCNGAGSCVSGTTPCAPYKCGATSCKTTCATDDDCSKDGYCAGTVCVDKLTNGKACTAANECAAGFCVDGVCCESACNGQCQSCNEPGTAGKCATVNGAPRASRTKCVGDPTQCGGACDGVNPAACAYAPATKACGNSCKDGKASKSTCDGVGNCADPTLTSCGAYACAGDVCGTTCSTDAECTSGYRCKLGSCVPAPKGTCASDRSKSQALDGTLTECGNYLCDPGVGTCLTTCGSSADCASGYLCDNKSCVSAAAPEGESGGCTTGHGSGSAGALLGLLVLVSLRRRAGS